MPGAFVRDFSHAAAFKKSGGRVTMEEAKANIKNKGGRPKKGIKKDQLLSLKCSLIERKVIEGKAKTASLSVSKYLRQMGLKGKIERLEKVIPREVLELTGTMNHLAANLNQIAKKRNSVTEELTILDRVNLKMQSQELKALAAKIKTYLR